MAEYVVASVDEIGPGERLLVEIEGMPVAVFNLDWEYTAYVSWCPHQGGPLCEGSIHGTTEATFDRETLERTLRWVKRDRVIVCPWHGWEFDLETGNAMHEPRIRVPQREVRVEDGEIVIST